ncbi:chromate transporter [Nannizzia gypsea CBS 118893]|uniref:Chromate transporter n=1 Tax=Arthroderma gypseum (strain ATCC MYA-4604 / CBS 118893) TaxID=535722 RepID=E5QZJ3_ARTGP|nr:chromate transporter [Nannizzia gypsea CBS 118893]EFQ97359.1 chromate transporter [Nannizzia gypsea CBS 118893]
MATDTSLREPVMASPINKTTDEESQSQSPPIMTEADSPSPLDDQGMEDNSAVPRMSYLALFWFFFYHFGLFAWGGPVAQIALIKEKLVLQDKWITLPRFQRVFAVYQILPGPEAAELCMFFGCLSRGRIGGIVAGIGFILPGLVLMLLASYLYSLAGFENKYFNASFRALQPVVAAMILRATHKIADHSVRKQNKKINPFLVMAAVCTAINSALRINIFISLGLYGIIYTLIARRWWIPAGILFALQYVGYALYVVFRGVPSPVSLALGIARTPSLINLFVLGLVAGALSFGGAYTAIPFIQVEAVLLGAWLPQRVFIDCIAIGNVLPAPLVIFATFVGFQGGYVDGSLGKAFAGAVIITIGIFLPCFVFTIAGHRLLEKLVRNKFLASFFDGLCGSVIGVIAVIAAQLLKACVEGSVDRIKGKPMDEVVGAVAQVGPAAVLYVLALGALYKFSNKYTALLLVIIGAVAGQFLFVD